jgi:hypothetical protein
MFTSKIYECLKQYLDRYLYEFDHNLIEMSIFKGKPRQYCEYNAYLGFSCRLILFIIGNINLKQVNLRPDEINRLLDGLSLPIALKAGMIGNLQINVTIYFLDDYWSIAESNFNFSLEQPA